MIIKRRWWQRRYTWVRKNEAYFDRGGRKRKCLRSGFRLTFYFKELL